MPKIEEFEYEWQKSERLYKLGYYDYAIECYDNIIESHYDILLEKESFHFELWYFKCKCHIRLNRFDEASHCFNKASKIKPDRIYGMGADLILCSFEKAQLLIKLKDHTKIISYCDFIIEINNMDYKTWNLKGISHANLKDYSNALECFDKALEIDPTYSKCLYNKGTTFVVLKKYKNALECFDKALEIDPNNIEALNNKAWILSMLGRNIEAKITIEKALALDNNYAFAWDTKGFICQNMSQFDEAINCFDKAIEKDESHLDSLISKGTINLRLRRYESALKCFTDASNIERNNGDILAGMGQSLSFLNENEKAIECFDEALVLYEKTIDKDPSNVNALNGKGIILAERGKMEEAIECFDKIIQQYEGDVYEDYDIIFANRNKGVALLRIGNYQKALECFEKIREIDNNFAYILNGKGVALTNIGHQKKDEKEIKKAIECFDRSLKLIPSLVSPLLNKGYALDTLGNYEKAIECFDEALIKEPDFIESLVSKGRSYGNLRNYEKAIECFDEAISYYEKNCIVINPYFSDAYRYKGYSLLITSDNTENFSEIFNNFKKATEIDSTSPYAWNSRGHALLSIGEYKEAIECFDSALEINEKFVFALANKGYALSYLGKPSEAMEYFDKALEIDNTNPFVFNYRGLLFSHLKRYNRSIECFDKALKITFDNYALANKGYALISQGNPREAINCFEGIKEINKGKRDPVLAYALNGNGVALDELGRTEEAIEFFDKSMSLDPKRQSISNFNIGRSKYKMDQYSNALENFRKIQDKGLEAQKQNATALCNFKLGLYEEAEIGYKEAIKIDPNIIEPFYNLGVLYYIQGKIERSKVLLNSCLNIDKSYNKATHALKQIEGSNQVSDWYQWWFKSDKGKKALGITLIATLILLFSVTVFASIFVSHNEIFDLSGLSNFISSNPIIMNLFNDSNNSTKSISSATDGTLSEGKPDFMALFVLIILFLIILLFPSLKTIKMGTVELATAPITINTIEIKPSTPMPFKSIYMTLHFHMPLKPELRIFEK